MPESYVKIDGVIVPTTALTLPRSRALAQLLGSGALPFASLVECMVVSDGAGEPQTEKLVLDLDVERPQKAIHNIQLKERVAVAFDANDTQYPQVLALRDDFPLTPHQNHTTAEFPRSLCIYENPWSEVSLRWTPFQFIESIRNWLALTAKGLLHQNDQPLEPLLFGTGLRIIIPDDLFGNAENQTKHLFVQVVDAECKIFVASHKNKNAPNHGLQFVATSLAANPQTHGIIRKSPANLSELHELLKSGGIDLLSDLRSRILGWERKPILRSRLILLVAFPLTREAESEPEKWDFWAFLTRSSIEKVGTDIGIWQIVNGEPGLCYPPDDKCRGENTTIDAMLPYVAFNRSSAALASHVRPDSRKVVIIGAGALGSQTITGLARSGFGTWTIIDQDVLLPHNLARHSLTGMYVGHSKAFGVAISLNDLYHEEDRATDITANVLLPGEESERIKKSIEEAALILDGSASVSVARHLTTKIESSARRISFFLNPQGTDLVILAEDKERKIPLDSLEGIYYRATATDEGLNGHFGKDPGSVRYGRSCGDISALIPSYLVTMHAAIASHAIRSAVDSDDASIRVWRCDPSTTSVTQIDIAVTESARQHFGEWTMVLDSGLTKKIASLRLAKLPNETGGVLIGYRDIVHRTIYLLDTLPSPPDSEEWPTLYIRGSKGLSPDVNRLSAMSGNNLEYIGEWHSHPAGYPTLPSTDDIQVFAWLTEHLALAGYPAVMAIAGDNGIARWFLGQIVDGWEA